MKQRRRPVVKDTTTLTIKNPGLPVQHHQPDPLARLSCVDCSQEGSWRTHFRSAPRFTTQRGEPRDGRSACPGPCPRVTDKAARGISDFSVLCSAGFSLTRGPRGARGGAEPGGGGQGRSLAAAHSRATDQRAWSASSSGEPSTFWGEIPGLGAASCCRSRCLETWSGLCPQNFPQTRRFLAAAVAARFKSSSPRIRGEWGYRCRARGSGPRAALYSSALPTLFLFLPFITFALPVSPFFNPYVCAVYTRSWASGKPAPQESGFCPVVGPALLKARLRRRQKSGVRGSGSQPWSGTSAFTILSPSRVSPSMTWRNSLCLQK